MTQSTYNKAHHLQEEIKRLVYELEVMEQNYHKPTCIRFGNNFNVSIPIQFDADIYIDLIAKQMYSHKERLQQIKDQFNAL